MYKRDYMRRSSSGLEFNGVKWVVIINVAIFIIQELLRTWGGRNSIEKFAALSVNNIQTGKIWTFITYGFLHGGLFHILVNMLVIFFVGKILEPFLGTKRFIQLFLFAVLMGGVAWLSLNFNKSAVVVGASAGAFGLMTFFCLLYPERPVTFLLFFILPLNLKPKWILIAMICIESFLMLFYELPGHSFIASSSHLGGILGGFLMYQFILKSSFFSFFKNIRIEAPKWMKGKVIHKAPYTPFKLNLKSRKELQEEVDRVLDKINTEGFGSLTKEEKRILDKAKDILEN